MAVDQEKVSKLFLLFSHPLRREILSLLNEKNEQSFTDLMMSLDIDTGKLSFHIRKLKIFLEQTPTGKYKLSKQGQNALRYIRDLEALSIVISAERKTTLLPIASLKRRILAFIVDLGVAFTITVATTLIANIFFLFQGRFNLDLNIFLFLTLLWIYSTLLEGFAGQTLGKALFGLKVVSIGGKKLSYDAAAVRNFGKCYLLPIDLLVGLRQKDKRFIRYFDKFSGTTVLKIQP